MSPNMEATYEWLREHGFMVPMQSVSILSIDAWHDGEGWTWNQWWKVGEIDLATLATLTNNRKILRYMRAEGYLSADSAGLCAVNNNQYNLVICERSNMMPLFAIAYGEAYQ